MVLVLAAAWLAISAPFLGSLRAGLLQNWLDRAGYAVTLSGPVSIGLGRVVHVAAEGIALDSAPVPVTIGKAEADLSLADLMDRKVQPGNIVITGASVSLSRDADGKIAGWSVPRAAGTGPDAEAILAGLAGQTIRLLDTEVRLEDRISGFSFDADLATLDLRGDGGATVEGQGTLNGQPLELSASVPTDAPVSATVKLGETSLLFSGAAGSKGIAGAMSGRISAESTDLSQTLKILQLEPVLKGKAGASATLAQTADGLTLTDIDVSATLAGGQTARVSGALGDLRKLDDTDIAIEVDFYPAGQKPAAATLLKDLRLVSFRQTLAGPLRGDTRRGMTIVTNGFQIDTADVGPAPFRFAEIARGPEGQLVVGQFSLRVGPPGAPWLMLAGPIGDLLTLSGFKLDGQIDLPISTIIGAGDRNLPAEWGSVTGEVKVTGSVDALSLTGISLAAVGTDLWSLGISGSIGSVVPLDGIDLRLDASLKAGAMLQALGKEPIDLAPLEFHLATASTDDKGTVSGKLSMQMGSSNLVADLSANNRGPGPVVKGSVTGDRIDLTEVREGINAADEILAAFRGDAAAAPASPRPRPRPEPGEAPDTASDPAPDTAGGDVQDITLQFVDEDRLLRQGDVNIAIRIDRITGESTIEHVDADLVVMNGQASLGPLKLSYAGGHFDVLAAIDTVADPTIVRLKGSSSGWTLGEVFKLLRVKTRASGTVDAEFELSGDRSSLSRFLDTLDGSATVSMRNGAIDSSLLDLAGLGIVPWLFSKDRRDRDATITCLRVPLTIRDGVLSTQRSVMETPEVQLVAYGTINLPRGTINIAGQPRPIGKPLARSPWPFLLQGALADPKLTLKDGPSRIRRRDGADRMPARRKPCVPDILQLR